jgi:hypothetical protein
MAGLAKLFGWSQKAIRREEEALQAVWSEDLGCFLRELRYTWVTKTGIIIFPPANCCDMKGCIQLFKRIDPKVICIRTYAEEEPDTIYRYVDGEWCAYIPAPIDGTG